MELLLTIPLLIGITLLIWMYKDHENSLKKMDKFFKELNKGVRDISFIQESKSVLTKVNRISSAFVELKELIYIFRYSHEKDQFWIQYYIENKTEENKNFSINKVELEINGQLIESDLTLLLEKVPEFMAPPYGNRYFSTKSYFGFSLGKSGQKGFLFNSRFKYELNNENRFSKCDSVTIYIDIQEYKDGQFITTKEEVFFEYFKNISSYRVQEIDDVIKWNE